MKQQRQLSPQLKKLRQRLSHECVRSGWQLLLSVVFASCCNQLWLVCPMTNDSGWERGVLRVAQARHEAPQ
jgi:hypothetical protein